MREFCELAFEVGGQSLRWEGEGLEERGVGDGGKVLIRVDPHYFRPAEVDSLIGDYSKAKSRLGWGPIVTFRDLVRRMVEADMA